MSDVELTAFGEDIVVKHDLGDPSYCQNLIGSHNHMMSIRVRQGVNDSPSKGEQGLLWYIDGLGKGATEANFGTQFFWGLSSGKIWQREMKDIVIGNEPSKPIKQVHPTPWVESSRSVSDNWIAKPEKEPTIGDANQLQYSGIFRTREAQGSEQATQHLPQGVNKWGVLQHFYENVGGDGANKTGFQLYSPIDGEGFGNLYIRAFNDAKDGYKLSDSKWIKLELAKLSAIQDSIFTHPSLELDAVDANTPTGFYLTTENTTGLEGIPDDKKDGVLKVTKDGDLSLQRYQPSIEGNTEVYIRTINALKPISRQGQQPFEVMKAGQGYVKIINDRNGKVPNPSVYVINNPNGIEHGYVMYEWKYSGALGQDLPEANHNRDILVTYEPYPKDSQLSGDYTDVTQIAYVDDGRTFIRHGNKNSDTWAGWKELGAGGSSTPTDIMTELKNMFSHWKTT